MEDDEKRNYIRLCILILDFGRDNLLHILKLKVNFKILKDFLANNKKYITKILSHSKKLLYPKGTIHEGSFYKKLDFKTVYVLLREILAKNDSDLLANIAVLHKANNVLFNNPRGVHLNTKSFEKTWIETKHALECLRPEEVFLKVSEIYKLQIESDGATLEKEDIDIAKSSSKHFDTEIWPTKREYKWTKETHMYLQISELVLNDGSDVLRAFLYERLPPSDLSALPAHMLHEVSAGRVLTLEKRLETGTEPWHCYDNFDFTLLYELIRKSGKIPPHSNGWGKRPTEKDSSLAANIDRLNGIKLKLMNNRLEPSLSAEEFEDFKHEALHAIRGILKCLSGVCSVQGKLHNIYSEETSVLEISKEKEQRKESKILGRSKSQPVSLTGVDSSTSLSGVFDNQSIRMEDTTQTSSSQKHREYEGAFNKFKIKHKDKLFKCFLGYSPEDREHGDIFIMAYLKRTLTKSKYWEKFENIDVLYVDCNFVDTEAAEAMYSKESVENPIEFENMENMKKIIGENSDELMKKHSNLEIISASSVISRSGKIFVEPCIVLYCRTKGVIPLGEEKFPVKLGEYNTDVREGFFQWAPGDDLFPAPNVFHNQLKMGCNIGLRGKGHSGTLGGFVDTREGMSFLTCAHVFYDQDDLENLVEPRKDDYVVQPADGQVTNPTAADNRTCGRVLKFVFDVTGPVGIDAAVVSVIDRKPTQGEFTGLSRNSLTEAGYDYTKPLRYNSGKYRRLNKDDMYGGVIKCGARTGLTRGVFKFHGATIKVFDTQFYLDQSVAARPYSMNGQLEIQWIGSETFAQTGDSGSFVFLVEKDRSLTCIGMVEGYTAYHTTIVTPITDILQKLEIENMELYSF